MLINIIILKITRTHPHMHICTHTHADKNSMYLPCVVVTEIKDKLV